MITLEQAIETVKREFPRTAEYKRHHLSESVIESVFDFDNAYSFSYKEPKTVTEAMKRSGLPGFWASPWAVIDKETGKMTVAQYPYVVDFDFKGEPKISAVEKRVT